MEEMGYDRFTEPQLRAKEKEILREIGFDADLPTVFDALECLFGDFLCQHNDEMRRPEERKRLEELKDLCIKFAVLCCYDHNMVKYK